MGLAQELFAGNSAQVQEFGSCRPGWPLGKRPWGLTGGRTERGGVAESGGGGPAVWTKYHQSVRDGAGNQETIQEVVTGHYIMQITGGRFKGEQPTLAHFQLRLLRLLLHLRLCPKVIGGHWKDMEKTQTRTKDARKPNRRKPDFQYWERTWRDQAYSQDGFGQESPLDVNTTGGVYWGVNVSPHRCFRVVSSKRETFSVPRGRWRAPWLGNQNRHHQWEQMDLTSSEHITSAAFPGITHNLDLMMKPQANPQWGTCIKKGQGL